MEESKLQGRIARLKKSLNQRSSGRLVLKAGRTLVHPWEYGVRKKEAHRIRGKAPPLEINAAKGF